MSLITIPGMTEDAILNTSTTPSSGGLRPFPCDANGWTSHTAFIVKASVKTFDSGNDSLSLVVANEQYGGEILVSLDPSRVAPGFTGEKAAKMQADNLKTLLLAIKILGCHTSGKLDTKKLEKVGGDAYRVTVIAKHKGFRQGNDGRSYHKVSLILVGTADELKPVTGPALPPLPGSAPAAPVTSIDDDFTF